MFTTKSIGAILTFIKGKVYGIHIVHSVDDIVIIPKDHNKYIVNSYCLKMDLLFNVIIYSHDNGGC